MAGLQFLDHKFPSHTIRVDVRVIDIRRPDLFGMDGDVALRRVACVQRNGVAAAHVVVIGLVGDEEIIGQRWSCKAKADACDEELICWVGHDPPVECQ